MDSTDLFAKIEKMEKTYSPAVLGFYGYSNTGKTTLISGLIENLTKRGMRVGVVKITDQAVRSEPEGKDTTAFRSAGAVITSFSSSLETNLVFNQRSEIDQIISSMVSLRDLDLILVEGANDPEIPKIRLGDKPLRENTILTYEDDPGEVERIINQLIKEKEKRDETQN